MSNDLWRFRKNMVEKIFGDIEKMLVRQGEWMFGFTGLVGRDGILSLEQRVLLGGIQQDAAEAVEAYFETMKSSDKFPMIAMATGIGKGNIIHRVIEEEFRKNPTAKVLIVAGTKNILVNQTHTSLSGYQAAEDINDLTDETADIKDELSLLSENSSILYKTGAYGDPNANVHVATIQKIQAEVRRGSLNPDDYNTVIVDEVHNIGTQRRYAAISRYKRVLGLTATPYRHSGRLKVPEDYGFKIIKSLTLPEAQELGLLPPLLGVQIDTAGLVDDIPTDYQGKINYKKLEGILSRNPDLRPYIADRIAPIISSEGRNYKTSIAVNFVWEAQELAQLLRAKGLRVGIAVNEQASKQFHSEDIPAIGSIERYKLPHDHPDSLQILISPYVASEGFDAPFSEVLVWASPTDSPLRYTQYTGRLARRAPGKLFGTIIDCLYQTEQYKWTYNFGMWMKDKVQQFDNGLLWLGKDVDIETIKNLPVVRSIIDRSDTRSLDELQREMGLMRVQDGEFPVVKFQLLNTFRGGVEGLMHAASEIVNELRESNPDLVVKRLSHSHRINIVLDRERFIAEMAKRGYLLRDPEVKLGGKAQGEEIYITEAELMIHFIGMGKRLKRIAEELVADLQITNPEIVKKKQRGKHIDTVIIDKDKFVEEMMKRNVRKRD